jgi:GTP cyclohydrolase II
MTDKGGRRGKAEVMQDETADADGAPPEVEKKSDVKDWEIERRVLQYFVMTERDLLSESRPPCREFAL